ncbi:hypothetical protein GGR57DRAFT_491923 [Xylariaceae sp. FL1272]|nr:hypothetical protein GGR57DRAFT_491923 [Xylariaceae sp. FL1272]
MARSQTVIDLTPDSPVESRNPEIDCRTELLTVFPDICPDYLVQITIEHAHNATAIISAILDKQDKGEHYPKAQRDSRFPLKRKRRVPSDGSGSGLDLVGDHDGQDDTTSNEGDPTCVRNIRAQINDPVYAMTTSSPKYRDMARLLISQDFPRAPVQSIRNFLLANRGSLFETYTFMDDKTRNWTDENAPWKGKKIPTRTRAEFSLEELPNIDLSKYFQEESAALVEFKAAREFRAIKETKVRAKAEEQARFLQAKLDGQTVECGICFDEFALTQMVSCQGENMHWFCRACLKTQAETQIGMGKYELTCMSMDGCLAEFSRDQKNRFLDRKLETALDRIEQEAMLRMAGIENLETCPFCPYAAEYPPVEMDKEFRCDNPQCQQVSCRLCRRETHIPKSCAEADEDRGLDARHILEEAMSDALIRRCNQCQSPFVKDEGCNKMRCSKCGTMMCDVCRQTIKDYTHFNDVSRGGKTGRCALYDQSQSRYEQEVRKAEESTRKKVKEDNPEVVIPAL